MNNIKKLSLFAMTACLFQGVQSADLVKAKDPDSVKRYEGSIIIAHQPAKYDEYYAATNKERNFGKRNPFGDSAMKLEGNVSRWTYLVPDTDRTSTEVFANYKQEFKRLDLDVVYAPDPDEAGWLGPVYNTYADTVKVGQILAYNETEERYLIAKTKGANPTYYVLFTTVYSDGVIPSRLENLVKKGTPLVQLDIIAPVEMEEKMVFVKAEEMQKSLDSVGHIALYGLYFDTDKAELKDDSKPSLDEVAKLLKSDPDLKLYVVGHTDNQGSNTYNEDLSQRRAASIVKALTGEYGISAARLHPFGAGLYAPVASNDTEEGRAKNRRVELVKR